MQNKIIQLRKERKKAISNILKELQQLLIQSSVELVKITKIMEEKSRIEKYYFETITRILLTERNKLQKEKTREAAQNLAQLNKQAQTFEAELLMEKLELAPLLKIPPTEQEKMKKRLYSIGFKWTPGQEHH
ncbi:hypothetical protein [Bacillus sp. FJAT-45066]|uniref:hypothetical protein n=1 Tax=Bacillus sp. FJAT-45066 TaxID=2011010 RepID=UPI000BB6D7C5|nr:hypothetical protein [Bacillus sp. FJAT-45066]